VVLASGTGSLLESLLEAAVGDYPARVVAVGTDRECRALDVAAAAEVPGYTVRLHDHPDRESWDQAITDATREHAPDLVVSAGFMKILGPQFLSRFIGRIVNTHPALLPAFPGAHAVPDALAYGVRVTGTTVHLVDAGMDTGPILAQEAVARLPKPERPLLFGIEAASRSDTTARFSMDRTTPLGYHDALNYHVVVNWVIAEHKSQGLFQMECGKHDLEQFWLLDGADEAEEQLHELRTQLCV